MAHNPQAPQGPNQPDPAGSTQMFQAFVNDGGAAQQQPTPVAPQSSGPRIGVILGVAVAITVLAVVAWLALG
ncbi:hypothetical protein [Streptomyces hainanensis]|uniref:Uncharacterized protein n=1 Tax=Streptomyces hainanensis TaxID=402648 RepID=A0A4V2Y2T8_9ACTN|nr:hypothetical protein [Streptomyces hainanensis]TDC73935.1 hypothetical protein E1283_17595 [Streptomyces hainanensis]